MSCSNCIVRYFQLFSRKQCRFPSKLNIDSRRWIMNDHRNQNGKIKILQLKKPFLSFSILSFPVVFHLWLVSMLYVPLIGNTGFLVSLFFLFPLSQLNFVVHTYLPTIDYPCRNQANALCLHSNDLTTN